MPPQIEASPADRASPQPGWLHGRNGSRSPPRPRTPRA